jgi:chaperonin GroEL (HSP60 family)
MISRRARTFRHDGKKETAVEIVKKIIPQIPVPLEIQAELSLERARVVDTAAGKYIKEYLLQEKEDLKDAADLIRLDGRTTTVVLQEIKGRIDEDLRFMQVPIQELLVQAEAAIESGTTQDGGTAEVGPLPRKTFLQKLAEMIGWMNQK